MERTALRRDEFIIMGGVQGEGGSSLGRDAEELVNQALRFLQTGCKMSL